MSDRLRQFARLHRLHYAKDEDTLTLGAYRMPRVGRKYLLGGHWMSASQIMLVLKKIWYRDKSLP